MSRVDTAAGDLERIVPDVLVDADAFGRDVLKLHLDRYHFASRWACGARVLDIACGVGYGTELLRAAGARPLVGVDRDRGAVAYARARYGGTATTFIESDALKFSDPDGFDLVVSLETIEHVPDPAGLIGHLARLLRSGGHLVASVPTSPSTDVNPHHLHDISENGFRSMIGRAGLQIVDELHQTQSVPLRDLMPGRTLARPIRRGLLATYAASPRLLLRRVLWTLGHGLSNHYVVFCARR